MTNACCSRLVPLAGAVPTAAINTQCIAEVAENKHPVVGIAHDTHEERAKFIDIRNPVELVAIKLDDIQFYPFILEQYLF